MSKDCKISLQPSGESLDAPEGGQLLKFLKDQGIYISSSCGGVASCGECMVKVVDGAENITPPTFDEKKLLGNVFHITRERLSCQCELKGDITLDISHQRPPTTTKKAGVKLKKLHQVQMERAKKNLERQESKANKASHGGKRRPRPFRTPPKGEN